MGLKVKTIDDVAMEIIKAEKRTTPDSLVEGVKNVTSDFYDGLVERGMPVAVKSLRNTHGKLLTAYIQAHFAANSRADVETAVSKYIQEVYSALRADIDVSRLRIHKNWAIHDINLNIFTRLEGGGNAGNTEDVQYSAEKGMAEGSQI